jgi:multidrug efflux pump subunit AcrA (membrane-fusion protein)
MRPITFSPWVAASLLAAIGVACAEEEPPPEIIRPVIAMQVARSGALDDRWFPGRAKATREANIAFEVSGRLVERPVEVGASVEEGQLLAKLDPRDFLNALNQARAVRTRSRAFRDRVAQAAKTGAVSRQELTDAVAEFEATQAEVEIRARALEDSELLAPFDGTVSSRVRTWPMPPSAPTTESMSVSTARAMTSSRSCCATWSPSADVWRAASTRSRSFRNPPPRRSLSARSPGASGPSGRTR